MKSANRQVKKWKKIHIEMSAAIRFHTISLFFLFLPFVDDCSLCEL